jgi:hypothetical protein
MRLNCGNAFHHSDQKLLSSHLLSKNVKIDDNLSCGCVWVFENRVFRRIFGPWRQLHNLYSLSSVAKDRNQWRALLNAVMNL